MEKIKKLLELNTVRKKVMMLSKLTGGIIVLFYLVTYELPAGRSITFLLWFGLLASVIMGVDFFLGRLISKPLNEINDTAEKMAELDFTAQCKVKTNDEFGELSQSLNTMFANLKDALEKLEAANNHLEKDVEHERLLLDERKELADSLSHEMKTPLGLIRAYTEGLREEKDEVKKQQYMDTILSASERMELIIASLLDLSALEAGASKFSQERFDFIEMAETAAGRLLMDNPEADYQLTYELPEQKVFVRADRRRMEQVLDNLIGNARKYVSPGGDISLSVKYEDDWLRFSVFNSCPSIPEEEIPRLWSKFYRRKNAQQGGSGLGLAIVAQILSMYDVPYGVRSQEEGIEFYFRFPVD